MACKIWMALMNCNSTNRIRSNSCRAWVKSREHLGLQEVATEIWLESPEAVLVWCPCWLLLPPCWWSHWCKSQTRKWVCADQCGKRSELLGRAMVFLRCPGWVRPPSDQNPGQDQGWKTACKETSLGFNERRWLCASHLTLLRTLRGEVETKSGNGFWI